MQICVTTLQAQLPIVRDFDSPRLCPARVSALHNTALFKAGCEPKSMQASRR